MDVVYIVGPGTHYHELRWSLRSVAAHLPHDRVWLVGCRPPWVRGVEHVGVPQTGPKHANTWANWKAIADHPAMSPQVVFMNDDFFLMRPVTSPDELPLWHQGPIDAAIEAHRRTGRTDLLARKLETREMLHRLGYRDVMSWELHIPLVIDRKVLADAVTAYESIARPGAGPCLCKRTWYATIAGLTGHQHPDVKVTKLGDPFDPTSPLLSTTEQTFTAGAVGELIRARFPTQCRYERTLQEAETMTWRFRCTTYPNLVVPAPGGAVRFRDGVGSVHRRHQAEHLIRHGAAFGIELISAPGDGGGTSDPAPPSAGAAAAAPAARPTRAAAKPAWVTWAVHCGAHPDEAGALTKAELIARYGG